MTPTFEVENRLLKWLNKLNPCTTFHIPVFQLCGSVWHMFLYITKIYLAMYSFSVLLCFSLISTSNIDLKWHTTARKHHWTYNVCRKQYSSFATILCCISLPTVRSRPCYKDCASVQLSFIIKLRIVQQAVNQLTLNPPPPPRDGGLLDLLLYPSSPYLPRPPPYPLSSPWKSPRPRP